MTDFENKISTVEEKPKNPEKKVGVKESLKDLTRNIISKFDRLLNNFKSSDKELEEIDKSIDLPPAEIKDIKEEMKITENVDVLNKEAEKTVEEGEKEIDTAVNSRKEEDEIETNQNKKEADPDYYKQAEDCINKNDFESAQKAFLLINGRYKSVEQGAFLETYPKFREFYENSLGEGTEKWLNDKKNKIDPTFNPNISVKNILKQPSGEIREMALKNYKDNLVRQKEALGNITTYLEFLFRNNPEIKEEEFLKILNKYETDFSLSGEQKQPFNKVFEEFKIRQKVVNNIRKEFPDDQELYKKLFGAAPEGKIQLISRSATLTFRCEKQSDYLRMRSDNKENDTSQGFSTECYLEDKTGKKVLIPVLGERVEGEFKNIDSYADSDTLIHEEQHAFKNLFNNPKFNVHFLNKNIEQFSPESQRQEINKFLDYKAQKISFNQVASEILAQFKGSPQRAQFLNDWMENYNFSEKVSGDSREYLKERFSGTPLAGKIDEYVDNYFKNNYNDVVGGGVEAVQNLYEYYQDPHKVTSLLINENLVNWPKIAKRILETKKES